MLKYNEDTTVLNTDAWDHYVFNNIYSSAPKFSENISKLVGNDSSKYSLVGDVFNAVYKQESVLKSQLIETDVQEDTSTESDDLLHALMKENNIEPIQNVKPTNPNELLMKKVLENDEYLKLHEQAQGDKLHSTLATMSMSDEIYTWLEEKQKNEDFKNAQKEQQQAQKALDEVNQRINERLENGNNPTKLQEKRQQQAQQALDEATQQLLNQMESAMNGDDFGNMIRSASEKANEVKEGTKNLLGGAGQGEAELKNLPLHAQIALADMLRKDNRVKEIAEMTGKFKKIARKKQKQKFEETVERSSLSLGNDIERITMQELAYFKNANTRLDFLKRFSENQVTQYSPKGKETLGNGAIVVCLDESSSMQNLNTQSKGFVIALAMIARKQKRDLIIIPFANNVGKPIVCEKGKVTTQNIVDLSTKFLNGGTSYTPALKKATESILQGKRFKKADIIFVTDGEPGDRNYLDKFIPELLEFKKKYDVNILSLLIGEDVKEEYVQQFSNKIIKATDFMNDINAHEALAI